MYTGTWDWIALDLGCDGGNTKTCVKIGKVMTFKKNVYCTVIVDARQASEQVKE
jgi:hypothetical protein